MKMTEEHPMMALLLEGHSFLGMAEKVEDEVMPLESQLGLGPGDVAVVAHAATPLENDLTIVKVVDPEQHEGEFPDWQDRVLVKSYLLCEAFSHADPEPHLGWYSRLKLLPITRYRYYQARRWQKTGFPDEFPTWVVKAHDDYQDQLAEMVPSLVPKPVSCDSCGKRDVFLKVERQVTYQGRAARILKDEVMKYVPLTDADVEEIHVTHLICNDCGWTKHLSESEWTLPGITTN
jgi:hypothetical protein